VAGLHGPVRGQRGTVDGSLWALLDRRFSCRAYLDRAVPRDDIEQMLALAQRTASWCNTQPWEVHVTGPAATRRLGAALTAAARAGVRNPDLEWPAAYEGVYRDRRREAGFGLYAALGIARDDVSARTAQALLNFDFFGAPHTAIITSDTRLGTYGAVDCGGYVATLLLAAESLGIATIAQAAIASVSGVVREELGLAPDRQVVCAVSFGYADEDAAVNAFRTTRADVRDAVHWID